MDGQRWPNKADWRSRPAAPAGALFALPFADRAARLKTFKTRHQFYLPDDLSERLEELAAKPGSSKTTILTDALRAWLERKAGDELDRRFGPRLDRQSRTNDRIEGLLEQVFGVLEILVLYQMTLTAHQPPFDEATVRLGRARFDKFMEQVARRLRKERDVQEDRSKEISDD